jgi:peptide/nickel transport system substrate-binding protein
VASVAVIEQGAKKCGVGLQVSNLNGPQYDSRRLKGQFDLAYGNQGSGPAPYFELRNWLFSKLTEPIGTDTETNFERWQDDKTDELIREYDTTLDKAKQKEIVNGLQQIMLEEVPFIPVTQNVSWSQTDTSRFTGWPTEDDPYANPAPYAVNWEVVLLRLKPVKK